MKQQDINGLDHLDAENADVHLARNIDVFKTDGSRNLLCANAYLGARAICRGLREGVDIIIRGRVSDASPVIGLSQLWHDWPETAFDELAGALLAGHIIECSAYVTGSNFCGFHRYPLDTFTMLDSG